MFKLPAKLQVELNEVTVASPGCLVYSKMAAIVHDFWATLIKDFIRKESSLEVETSVSTYCLHYLSID